MYELKSSRVTSSTVLGLPICRNYVRKCVREWVGKGRRGTESGIYTILDGENRCENLLAFFESHCPSRE